MWVGDEWPNQIPAPPLFSYNEDWDIELKLISGVDQWDKLLRELLSDSTKRKKLFMIGGSDAHGHFNYALWQDGYMGPYYVNNNAFGKVRTYVYCPNGNNEANVLSALKNGNSVVTDGPLVIFGIDKNNDGDIDDNNGDGVLDDNEDVIIGQEAKLASGEKPTFLIQWKSTNEVGRIKEIRIIRGDDFGSISITYLTIAGLNPLKGTYSHTDTSVEPNRRYYYRIEAETEDLPSTSPYYRYCRAYTNPIWVSTGSVPPPDTTVTITGATPSPNTVAPGDTFAITYDIYNNSSSSVDVMLGASIHSNSTGYISDPLNDKKVSVPPSSSQHQRGLKVPTNLLEATYDLLVALWSDTNNNNMIDSGDSVLDSKTFPNALTVTPLPNNPPYLPDALHQFKSDGITDIICGGTTDGNTVVFKGWLSDPDGDWVKLQIELIPLSQSFTGNYTSESDLVQNGGRPSIIVSNLANGSYHWQGRAVDSKGAMSNWRQAGCTLDPNDVDLVVNVPASPSICFSPNSLFFEATEGESNPPSQILHIWNCGGGTLSWSVGENAGRLSLNPTNGTSTGEQANVTVSVNSVGLSAGTFNDFITISAPGAANTPQTVPLTLKVNPVATRTLTVASINPSSGVPISVSPNDNKGDGNGTTVFYRTYDKGTQVTLTAPSSASGNIFQKWQRNGANYSTNPNIPKLFMDGNYTMTAVYETQGCLSVTPSGGLTSSGDEGGPFSSSSITYTLTNTGGSTINYSVNNLRNWLSLSGDTGGFLPPGTSTSVAVSINSNANNLSASPIPYTDTVNFANMTNGCGNTTRPVSLTVNPVITHTLTVASANPDSGVNITVMDYDGQGNDITPFTRTYTDNARVVLTSPPTVEGNDFEEWKRNGTVWTLDRTAYITIDNDYTMTATYTRAGVCELTRLGSYDTPDNAEAIYVSGTTAYVADRDSGLQIIDVATMPPTLLGNYDTPGVAYGVYVSGNKAYVADWTVGGLQIIDVATIPPTLLGSHVTPGAAKSVYVSDNTAYVADYGSGLQILDVTTMPPTLLGSYDTPSTAWFVYVSDTTAYVADGESGLQIIDVATMPPTLHGNYDTPGDARGVYVSGNKAYVADSSSGLQIIDITTMPPTLLGSYDTPSAAVGVYVSGNTAYVADWSSGLQIIDVSNPASTVLLGSYNTPGAAMGVYVLNNTAYVADGWNGLEIIDVSGCEAACPTYCRDADEDTFGDPNDSVQDCVQPTGYVSDCSDCNDNDSNEHTGQIWYKDADNDLYSDGTTLTSCTRPNGYKVVEELNAISGDCKDGDVDIHPGAQEQCNGVDDNCDGEVDEGCCADSDNDGFYIQSNCGTLADCNDNDPKERPNQTWYKDGDNDGYSDGTTITSCTRPNGYKVDEELTAISGDCNDSDASIRPNATEICDDGVDNDCDDLVDCDDPECRETKTYYRDADEDGCGDPNNPVQACEQPQGYVSNNRDCNDNDSTVCEENTYCRDADEDGYGDPNNSILACIPPPGYVLDCWDCDDNDSAIPGPEVCDDDVDNDCDGLVDCDDQDCASLIDCKDITYYRGSSYIKFNYRRTSKDKASLWLCIDECFCEALKEGVDEIVVWLDECNQITIPGSMLQPNKSKTKFHAKSSTYVLIINCRLGWLKLKLKNVDLKNCISNPVKTCVQITDGPCLCAEEEFGEILDRKGNLKKLTLTVTGACPSH